MHGIITALKDTYGFIKNIEGQTLYFNEKSLTRATEFAWLEIGSRVRFSVRKNAKGLLAIFVTLLDKPDFEWEEGALYVERAGKTFMTWRAGSTPTLGPGQRILESVECVTDYLASERQAVDHFRAMAVAAGANFAQDIKVEVAVKLVGGFAIKSYRCTGRFGVMVKPLKVKNPDEYEALHQQFQVIIETRLGNLRSFRDRSQSPEPERLVI